MKSVNYLLFIWIIGIILSDACEAKAQSSINQPVSDRFKPGETWPDSNGNHIQAHGGGIIKIKKSYFWYGEQRGNGLDPKYRYVSCYSSKDLLNWKFRGNVVKMLPPDSLSSNWVLERPKVFYNAATKKICDVFSCRRQELQGCTGGYCNM